MRLGDCCKTNLHTYSDKEKWSLIRYLDTGSITEGRIDEIQTLYPGVDKIPSRARRKASVGDILFSTVRPNQKHYGIIEAGTENLLVSTGFTVVTVDTTIAYPYFIYYYLTQSSVIESLQAIAEQSTSTYPSIKPSDIEDIELDLPELETQKKIGSTLRMLDRKIALNEEINDNLELQAQSLVTEYIEKTPYTTHLSDIITFDNGFAFQSKTYLKQGKYKIITIKNVQDGRIDSTGTAFINELPQCVRENCILSIGDILLSLTGNVGRVGIVYEKNLLLNQRVARVVPFDKRLLPFLYFVFRQPSIKTQLEMIAKGTAQLNLSPIEALNLTISYEQSSATALSQSLEALYKIIISNQQENLLLAQLRDTLLPKLMSGKIDVSSVQL